MQHKHHRILRDNSDTKKLVSGIENTLNLFNETYQDENLFYLSTGKTTSEIAEKNVKNSKKNVLSTPQDLLK